jgi:hypothetical protein
MEYVSRLSLCCKNEQIIGTAAKRYRLQHEHNSDKKQVILRMASACKTRHSTTRPK